MILVKQQARREFMGYRQMIDLQRLEAQEDCVDATDQSTLNLHTNLQIAGYSSDYTLNLERRTVSIALAGVNLVLTNLMVGYPGECVECV